ncbi:RNA recognition motif containing protein [Musa troglodytarum]|uniref:RNA recognition motif containing protein n=1 Tax=Musa troglodytarum TaxID=320322 RepID=A0A9E7K2R7_9LILI|nr:RNA recognition motif containing protein [Musa troglodytarum]
MASSSSSTSSPQYRSRFGDTTLTKVFVGGLAWETPTEELHRYFEQFGEILEAVIISDKITGRSKGYGFGTKHGDRQVTFRDPESARRSVADPNPVIDGRRANCNIASMGRPKPSPPRGRSNQEGSMYQGPVQAPDPPYSRLPAQLPFPSPPVMYPTPYGYVAYPSGHGYQQNGGKSLIIWCCVEADFNVQPPDGIVLLSTTICTNLSISCRSSALPLPSIRVLHPNRQGKFSFPGTRPTATSHGSHVFSAVPISTPIPITSKAAPEHRNSQAPQQTSTAGSDTDDQDS